MQVVLLDIHLCSLFRRKSLNEFLQKHDSTEDLHSTNALEIASASKIKTRFLWAKHVWGESLNGNERPNVLLDNIEFMFVAEQSPNNRHVLYN